MPRPVFPIPNGQWPKQGPVACAVNFDFTLSGTISGDLGQEQNSHAIDFVQSIWIDNRANPNPFTIVFQGTLYTIQCKAGREGIFPVICATGIVQFTAINGAPAAAAAIVIPTLMKNTPSENFVWDI